MKGKKYPCSFYPVSLRETGDYVVITEKDLATVDNGIPTIGHISSYTGHPSESIKVFFFE